MSAPVVKYMSFKKFDDGFTLRQGRVLLLVAQVQPLLQGGVSRAPTACEALHAG